MSVDNVDQVWTEESGSHTPHVPSVSKKRHDSPSSKASSGESGNIIVLTQQEGAERLARDINTKINDLEMHIGRLGDLFGQSQVMIKSSFDDLQSCNAGLTAELDRVAQCMAQTASEQSELTRSLDQRLEQSSSHQLELTRALDQRLEQTSSHQAEMTRVLEERFHQTIALLGGQLGQVGESLQGQQIQLDVLHAGQNDLFALQQKLESRADEQNAVIDALAEETGKKIQINKTHIEGLNALHREQQQNLKELISDLDQLDAQKDVLEDQLRGLSALSDDRWKQTGKHFRITAGVGAGVTVLLGALVAYLFIKPAIMPEMLETQLTEMTSDLGLQKENTQVMLSDMVRLRQDMEALQALVRAGGQDVNSLRSGQTETAENLQQLQAMLNSLQHNMDNLQLRAEGTGLKAITPSLPLNDARWVAGRDASHFTIQLAGVYRFPGLVAYINHHAASLTVQPLSFNKSQHLGRDWFNLYYGDFASLAEARAAMAKLPAPLLGNKPWIRSMKSVQASARQ